MSRVVWLLELDFGGHVVRASTRPVSVTLQSGGAVSYPGGLGEVEVTSTIEDGPTGRSVALTVAPPPDRTWASMALAGVPFSGARATLRRWTAGQAHEDAPVRAAGALRDVEWGRGPAPLVATIEAPPWGDGTRVVPERYAIGPETHPAQPLTVGGTKVYESDPQVIGALPAVVIGYPGDYVYRYTAKTATSPDDGAVEGPPISPFTRSRIWADLAEGSPALLADSTPFLAHLSGSRWVLARHQVDAKQVVIWDQSDERWDLFPVFHGIDLRGQTYAYAGVGTGTHYVRPKIGHEYWAVFLDDVGYGGGLPSDQGGAMTGLGEVLTWMLQQMAIPTSASDQRSVRDQLDRFDIQAVINSDITIWDWVRQEVLPLFPVRYVEGPGGGFVAPLPVVPTVGGAVDDIDPIRDGLDVVGTPREDTSRIANHLVLEYGRTVNGTTKRAVLTDRTSTDAAEREDPWCRVSQAKAWGRVTKTWSSDVIAQDETAWRVLRAKARELAMPRVDVVLSTSTDRLDRLWLLDEVELDPEPWGLPAGRYRVDSVTERGDEVQITFTYLREHP